MYKTVRCIYPVLYVLGFILCISTSIRVVCSVLKLGPYGLLNLPTGQILLARSTNFYASKSIKNYVSSFKSGIFVTYNFSLIYFIQNKVITLSVLPGYSLSPF